MKRRTYLLGLGTLSGAAGLISNTSAFSSVSAEREVRVEVVGDEEAFLRLEYPDQEITCNGDDQSVQLVEIGNKTGVKLEPVTVTIDSVPEGVTIEEDENITTNSEDQVELDDLGPGDSVAICVTVDSTDNLPDENEISFNVSAEGGGVSIETTKSRTVKITCENNNSG